jgi:hypothetical protein
MARAGSTRPVQASWIGFLPKCPMSAYSASAPVKASTMAPTAANTCQPRACRKARPLSGLSAARMAGWRTISRNPKNASTANHTTITGPNSLPTTAVPWRCTANRPMSTATEIGIT